MKTALATALSICLMSLAVPSYAGSQQGKVTLVVTTDTGQTLIKLSGTAAGSPACNTQGRFAFDNTTSAGAAQTAHALTALATGRTVSIHGKNTCVAWADSEDVKYIWMYDY